MDAIALKFKPANRREQRVLEKEYKKCLKHLNPINNEMLDFLFFGKLSLQSYNEVYTRLLDEWKHTTDFLHRTCPNIYVNKEWFSDIYGYKQHETKKNRKKTWKNFFNWKKFQKFTKQNN